MTDETLDSINDLKRQLKEIIEKNKKLKSSRNHSMATIKDLQHRVEVEQDLIRIIDEKVKQNTQEYYRISDEVKRLLKP